VPDADNLNGRLTCALVGRRGEVVDLPRPAVSDRPPATSLVESVRSELADLDAAGSPEGLALMALAADILRDRQGS
jgi:hypothetical protein